MYYKLLIAISFFTSPLVLFSQEYKITLENGSYIDGNNYEFDVFIKSTAGSLLLTSYQVALNYNNLITNGDNINFSCIEGSSTLENIPSVGIGTTKNGRYFVLTFASLPGNDTISEEPVKVGRFILSSTNPINRIYPNITWNFGSDVETILTGNNFMNITDSSCHYSLIERDPKDLMKSAGSSSDTLITVESSTIKNFELLQNYPNPFNPSTKIKFTLSSNSFVQLKIFNALGEEVKNVISGFLNEGMHEINFDAGTLPSGYYIYSLFADNKIISYKKMILLK